MRPAGGLDEGRVAAWIAALGIGARTPLRFARVGHGQSNLTFLVSDAAGARWVLRRPPLGRLLASAHDVAREHRILSALEGTGVPAPRVLGLCTDPDVSDVPLLLMEHVEGVVVDRIEIAERLPPRRRADVSAALASTLADVHAVDLERSGLDSLASHAPYAARQLKRWQGQWEASRTRDVPAIDALARRLRAAAPAQRDVTLVHGDFQLQNVVVDPGTGDVRAVLDWELCTLGDPLADLGTLLAYWPRPGDPAPAVFPAPALPGFLSREQLAGAYAQTSGRPLGALGFWHVLGLWKLAIIGEGVLRRAQEDPANAAPAGTAQAIDDLIVRALAVAEAEGL